MNKKSTLDDLKAQLKRIAKMRAFDNPSPWMIDCFDNPVTQPTQEQELWAAVVRESWLDLYPMGTMTLDKAQNRHDAKEWFAHEGVEVGSFRWVCDILGLNPEKMRVLIHRNRPELERRGRPHNRDRTGTRNRKIVNNTTQRWYARKLTGWGVDKRTANG